MPEPDNNNNEVRYTVKELLRDMNLKLDRIENGLASKADKALVDMLAQKIESVRLIMPTDLIKEHTQLLTQCEVSKHHDDLVDKQIEELHEWREASVSVKQLLVPIIALIITVIWTVFSIVTTIASGVAPIH